MFLDSEARNWYDARDQCNQEGGYLTEVDSEEENQAIVKYIITQKWQRKKEFWIGLNDFMVGGRWQWAHSGIKLGNQSYSNWWGGYQPDKLGWDCVHYNAVNEWDNKECYRNECCGLTYHAFCEIAVTEIED